MMGQKTVRFCKNNSDDIFYGNLENSKVTKLTDAPWNNGEATNESFELNEITFKAPVEPSKIICVGLNYHAHVKASYSADEAPDEPLLFLKPPSSIIGPDEDIIHPPQSERVDYEAELGIVIGKEGRNIPEKIANEYIYGYTCVNDVTARDLQKKDRQWARAKGFDTFCPAGPHIVTDLDYNDILIEGVVNGEVIQSGRTSLMIFKIPFLINYISSAMTLMPGDLISTGTPAKIAPMSRGDEIEVRIENVGSLKNRMA
jgi:2-keto-4-pentenoate hydratase/2-oxohepta-3-ene-1,7-dioic acid hydratase in catechol pathway